MDKKNTSLGILFIAAAFVVFWMSSRYSRQPLSPAQRERITQQAAQAAQAEQPQGAVEPKGPQPAFEAAAGDHAGSTVTTLENSFIKVQFSNFGGAIREVALKKFPYALHRTDPAIFNELHADPMLAFVDWPGLDKTARYELVSKTDKEVVYRAVLDGKLEVTRRYTIAPDKGQGTDPYQLRCETTLRNLSSKPLLPLQVSLSLGTAAQVSAVDFGRQLATGYFDGQNPHFFLRSSLEPSNGILGLGAHEAKPYLAESAPVLWATVKNQFFSAILTPDRPGIGLLSRRVKLFPLLPDTDMTAYGIAGTAQFAVPALPAGDSDTLGANFYVGPNEYHRLANTDVFKADQDQVMQFGKLTGWASKLLLLLMTGIHAIAPNWGIAIVLTTLTLKIVTLPLTLMAARNGRRMQKIQPEMQAVKEKYKDNPQKLQQATIELYKKHKINPAGACIPMLLPMPFFFGFFYMLQSSAELRLAPFLWAHDLSAPDTIGYLLGIPINVFPLLFVGANFLQMRITPQPTMDKSQAAMMKFMPILLLLFYYRYSCALSVYSLTNALFSMGQQFYVNRQKDIGDPADHLADKKGGRPVKNVTPKRR